MCISNQIRVEDIQGVPKKQAVIFPDTPGINTKRTCYTKTDMESSSFQLFIPYSVFILTFCNH